MISPKSRSLRLLALGTTILFAFFFLRDSMFSSDITTPYMSMQDLFHASNPEQIPLGPDLNGKYACGIWAGWDMSNPMEYVHGNVTEKEGIVVGDPHLLGDPDQCIYADSRFTQYGRNGTSGIKWEHVRWGDVQSKCARSRYGKLAGLQNNVGAILGPPTDAIVSSFSAPQPPNPHPRTAIVLRSWDDFNYTPATLAWMRAVIAETTLHSHGAYSVILLVHVRDSEIPIFTSREIYNRTLESSVPPEFRSMAYLFNEPLLQQWYPDIPMHTAQDQMYQALQVLAAHSPQFDYFWQLEMDIRMTGHVGSSLENMSRWAKQQPRRHLWERNGAFFLPELFSNSSSATSSTSSSKTNKSNTSSTSNNNASQKAFAAFSARISHDLAMTKTRTIWGALPVTGFTPEGPPAPPRSQTTWGIDEEADLISLLPPVDPIGTGWVYEDWLGGFPSGNDTPRRVTPISVTRTSRRLLGLISAAQRERGQWVPSEATPETFALLHGLKAVYAPHPVRFYDIGETVAELEAKLNPGPPENRAGGSSPSFCFRREGGLVELLWLGSSYIFFHAKAEGVWKGYVEDGKCLGPMILHPVKND